jgi:hypothetical protein
MIRIFELMYISHFFDGNPRLIANFYRWNHLRLVHFDAPCGSETTFRFSQSQSLSFKPQLNSIGLSVSHRKHIKSLLRAQQVNAIYRFVTMVY